MDDVYLLIGLGNPGKEYVATRHNIGADFLRFFAESQGADFSYNKYMDADVAYLNFAGKNLILLIPQTYMNKSGLAVKKAMEYFDIKSTEKILVLYDELNLKLGDFKFSFAKSSGGHKGLESIIDSLSGKNFWRLRIGIAKDKKINNKAKYVLQKFSIMDKFKFADIYDRLSLALYEFYKNGAEKAMNKFN